MNYNTLVSNIFRKRSFLCVGLDTDLDKIPQHLLKTENPIFSFNKEIVDATAEFAVSVKLNSAFYEAYGISGMQSMLKSIEYIRTNYPDLFIILDAKRGDIGNTSERYAKFAFDAFKSHAITVAPYMGSDSVKPFVSSTDGWTILLALTSNPGAFDFQFMEDKTTGEKLFEKVLKTSRTWGNKENMMYVVGATKAEYLKQVRAIVPDHFLLVPGVGAQGGSLEEVAQFGMTADCGLLINSSRAIIYADNTENFGNAARKAAKEVQEKMDKLLPLIKK